MTQSLDKGAHGKLTHPYIFVDSCVQIWPDADYGSINQCGVTAYAVTAWDPHETAAGALAATANWHRVARQYPQATRIVYEASDIVQAKKQGQAGLILTTQGVLSSAIASTRSRCSTGWASVS